MKSDSKETERMRNERISETNNGATLRTRVVPNKRKYKRVHKKPEANDEDD